MFCDPTNIKLIFCLVGDHRSDGLIEKLVRTLKIKLLYMAQEDQKLTLQDVFSKIIWNLRSSYQSKIKYSPFEMFLIENQTLFGNIWLLVNHPMDV